MYRAMGFIPIQMSGVAQRRTPADVDDPVEDAQEHQAVAAGDEDVGRRPELLDDRELDPPEPADAGEEDAREEHDAGLARRGGLVVAEELAGEDAEEAGGDGGDGGEEPLGVVRAIPALAGEEAEVEPVGEVALGAFGEVLAGAAGDGDEGHERPVAQEQGEEGDNAPAGVQEAKEEPGRRSR